MVLNYILVGCPGWYADSRQGSSLHFKSDLWKTFDLNISNLGTRQFFFTNDIGTSSTESFSIEISLPKCKKLLIWTIYRAPDLNIESFIQNLGTSWSALPDNIELILLGDFNVNFRLISQTRIWVMISPWNVNWFRWLDQLINKPTRITDRLSTLTDLFFSNTTHRVTGHGVTHLTISDHSMILCVIKSGVTKAPGKTIEYSSFKHYAKKIS